MTTETMQLPYVVDGLQADQPTAMDVPLEQIQIGETQLRVSTNHDAIREYADAIERGEELPYPALYFDGEAFWIGDGHHRIWAYHNLFDGVPARQGDQSTIPSDVVIRANVFRGGRREALLHAAGANAAHGLRRSNADKRNAVTTLLQDDEWSEWSNREIARRCGVDEKLVRTVRDELAATAAKPQSDARRGADGRVIDTANIGTRPAEASGRAVYVEEESAAGEEHPTPAHVPPEPDADYDIDADYAADADLLTGWQIEALPDGRFVGICGPQQVATRLSRQHSQIESDIRRGSYDARQYQTWIDVRALYYRPSRSSDFAAALHRATMYDLGNIARWLNANTTDRMRIRAIEKEIDQREQAGEATEEEPEPQPEAPANTGLDNGFVARMRAARQAFEAAREAIPEITSIGHYDDAADTDRHLAHVIKLIDRELEPFDYYEQHTAIEWTEPEAT